MQFDTLTDRRASNSLKWKLYPEDVLPMWVPPKYARELRWAMVEVAQRAVKADPHWKQLFSKLERRMHRNQAIVAIARHLLTLVWYVLTRHEPYAHYSSERIAYKYYTWSWQLNEAQRKGMTRPQFVRYELMRLGIGAGNGGDRARHRQGGVQNVKVQGLP